MAASADTTTTTTTTPSCTLAGRIALVTGGGSGIGRACCQVLAREGAQVVVTDINLQAAKHTLTLLPGGQQHVAVAMDVRERNSVEDAMRSAQAQYGAPPSLLVNCAGVFIRGAILETDGDSWQKNIDVNLTGTFLVTQTFATSLLENGKDSKGAVVNIASIDGKTGSTNWSGYAASKGGVISLTKTCAAELASKAIRVNCVLPGLIDTPMTASRIKESRENLMRTIPLGRAGRPEEVAEVVAFLLSERSSYMVGACVEVTGGYGM